MRCLLRIGRDGAAETKQIYLFVGVIKLQDRADLLNYLQVLIFHHAEVVQGFSLLRVAVTHSEVNSDVEVHSATAKHVL